MANEKNIVTAEHAEQLIGAVAMAMNNARMHGINYSEPTYTIDRNREPSLTPSI